MTLIEHETYEHQVAARLLEYCDREFSRNLEEAVKAGEGLLLDYDAFATNLLTYLPYDLRSRNPEFDMHGLLVKGFQMVRSEYETAS